MEKPTLKTGLELRQDVAALRNEAGESDPIAAAILALAAMVGEVAYQLAWMNQHADDGPQKPTLARRRGKL